MEGLLLPALAISDLPAGLRPRFVLDASGCWLWTGRRGGSRKDYGVVTYAGKRWYVHVLVWVLLVGPIPDGHELDHVKARGCLHKHCGNAAHLEPVTHQENTIRGDGWAGLKARALRATHCNTCGTPYDEVNSYIKPNGEIDCRCCRARRARDLQRSRAKRLARLAVLEDAVRVHQVATNDPTDPDRALWATLDEPAKC